MMLRRSACLAMVLFFVVVSEVFPWGGVRLWSPTHQLILTEAYGLLRQDPAFRDSDFLPIEQILAHEGVDVQATPFLHFTGVGPGPDGEGKTLYSWHYYNPITRQGTAPKTVADFYKALANHSNKAGGAGDAKAKCAAWSAHFLADMSVPYHVVGLPAADARASMLAGTKDLSELITGPLSLYDPNAGGKEPAEGWGLDHNFQTATITFVQDHSGGLMDWYDPWYGNGWGLRDSHETGTSSHVLWEKKAHKLYSQHPHFHPGIFLDRRTRYNPAWKNATPGYAFNRSVSEAQSKQAALFAHASAMYTREHITQIHENPGVGIDHAIRNVATLWRGSFSGLRLAMHVHKNISDDPNEYGLECEIRNVADAPANTVQVKLFLQDNHRLVYARILPGGTIGPRGKGSVQFRFKAEPETEYMVDMAAVAQYAIPDLQFAALDASFQTAAPAVREEEGPAEETPNPGIVGTWRWFTGSKVEFLQNGTMKSSGGNSGRWSGSGRSYTLRWTEGNYVDTLTLSAGGRKLTGNNQHRTPVSGSRLD